MKNRRQKSDPTTTNSMNRRHRKEFSCTRYINVAAIIPGWKWHPTLTCVFFISFFGFLSVSRVQRKPLRLSLSSNLPYENITGESKFDNSVCETTVSQHMPVFFFWLCLLHCSGAQSSLSLFHFPPCTTLILSPNAHHYRTLSLKPGLSVSC